MLRTKLATKLLVVAWMSALSARASGDGSGPFAAWTGTYASTSVEAASDTIRRAIERGTAGMGPLRRRIATRRLLRTNPPYAVIRILEVHDGLATEFDGLRLWAPSDGAAGRNVDAKGKPVQMSVRAERNELHARYTAASGEKRVIFELLARGDLMVRVTVLSPQLPRPIRYRVRFARRRP